MRIGKIICDENERRWLCVYQNIVIDVTESILEALNNEYSDGYATATHEQTLPDKEKLRKYDEICKIVSSDIMPRAS